MPYVTDTHCLIWYMTDDPQLSIEAKKIFKKADNAQVYFVIPCIVFFELFYLIEKRKIDFDFDGFVAMIFSSKNYRVEPLCLPIIQKTRMIPRQRIGDPWDRLIAATSIHLSFPLITRDQSLTEIGLEVIW
jgi:PIN domain nuclease of toxin-antitoxin system